MGNPDHRAVAGDNAPIVIALAAAAIGGAAATTIFFLVFSLIF